MKYSPLLKTKYERMMIEKRNLYRRNYLKKKNGNISKTYSSDSEDELSSYAFMLQKQNYVCAICKNKCTSGKALAIDHDHESMEVRGLLCGNCNRGLGLFKDKSSILYEAYKYLKRYGK